MVYGDFTGDSCLRRGKVDSLKPPGSYPGTMSSMNTQTRYRTLVSHLAKVYAADESARTVALHEGLDEIVDKLQPDGAGAWKQVKADSQRLLKVWMARETRPGDVELASQILDALDEFATDAAIVSAVAAVVITPPEPVPIAVAPAVAEKKPVPVAVAPAVAEKKPVPVAVAPAVAEKKPVPVLVVEEKVIPPAAVIQHVVDADDDEAEEETVVEEDAEEEEETETVEEVEEETEETEEVVEPEEEEEEEEEEEAAEEEEEGMEVEKKIFRGRAYWVDVNTNKLYAVIGDDDVGNEVGKVVDGRPVFLAVTR